MTSSFKPNHGLRQGDPLSPLLFIIGSEVLTRLIEDEESKDHLHAIKISTAAPTISHLMYTDDLFMLCRADRLNNLSFKRCFNKYCKWPGQEANLEKSNILFSKNTPGRDNREIKDISGFKEMGVSSIYLGNSLIMSRNRIREFSGLTERV